MPQIENLPIAPEAIKDGALAELEHLARLVRSLSPNDWSRPSAVEGWTVGDVTAHLDLVVGLYGPLLGAILKGGGASGMARVMGRVLDSVNPSATPVFDAINGAIPRVLSRLLSRERMQRQFVAGARNTRDRVVQVQADDYGRPVYHGGGPYPLSFYLAIIVHELAIHAWDIESAIADVSDLSEASRRIVPSFYWSATRLMFRPPHGARGIVQVVLSDPASTMWWSIEGGRTSLGQGSSERTNAEIRGPAGVFVLALAGRVRAVDVLRSSLVIDGDRSLAERFLSSWHLV